MTGTRADDSSRSAAAPSRLTPPAQALFDAAVRHHLAGRLTEAEPLYRQVLAIHPGQADCLHLLGVIAGQTGRHEQAIDLIGQAIAIDPTAAVYHSNLGVSLQQQGRLDEAIASFRAARDLKPDDPDTHTHLGIALKNQGRLEEAAACFRRALEIAPDNAEALTHLQNLPAAHQQTDDPEALFNQAVTLRAQGRLEDAIASYRRAIALKPDYPGAFNNLGNILRAQGRMEEAIACLRTAVELSPDYAEAHNNLGIALQAQGWRDEAVACYRRALELRPDLPALHNNLGTALQEQARLDDAVACYRRALDLNPNFSEAHNSLGAALHLQGRPDEAAAHYRKAVMLRPDYTEAYNNLGNALQEQGLLDADAVAAQRAATLEAEQALDAAWLDQGQLDEAASCYRKALELNPDYAEAHTNLAMALLARGNLAAGWEENEWRWKTPQLAGAYRNLGRPQWRGEAAAGQTLLIQAEQGFGDNLQFCRYAPLAAARGLRVILEVPKPLVRLFRSLPGIDQVVPSGEALPPFDLYCPVMSLPIALGTATIADIPNEVPYLRADPAQVASWRTRLAATGKPGPRIGMVWAGNPREHQPSASAVDRRRSIGAERLAPLFDIPGAHFVSLQKDGPAAPPDFPLTNFMREMTDFADTAALVTNLDLVIAVDTAVAHLSAALGRPVWLLDRFDLDWRWLIGRHDSPWYPTLRVFRQPSPGNWPAVVEAVREELQSFVAAHPEPGAFVMDVPALFAEAVARHQAGRVADAELLYRQIVEHDTSHGDSLHMLGVIGGQTGRHELAVEMIGRAIAIDPNVAFYHSDLAVSLRHLGQPEAAVAHFRNAADLRPDSAQAQLNLGIALSALRRRDEAISCFRRAIELRPDLPRAHRSLGTALAEQGLLDEAAGCFGRALELRPDDREALDGLRDTLRAQGQSDALVACRIALALKPDDPRAHFNLGLVLQEQDRPDEAVACYRKAVALGSDDPELHFGLGLALKAQDLLAEAVACYRRAIALDPTYPAAYNNLGNTLRALGQVDDAVASLRTGVELQPDNAEAHCNLALALLARGDLAAGWEENEWRWKTPQMRKDYRDYAVPLWRGEPAEGRTLLIHAEQGLGDNLQFCRYVPLAAARGLKIVLAVPSRLARLLRSLPGVAQLVTHGDELPPFDLRCPMLSLPRALGTATVAMIPADVPYLHADPAQAADWAARLAAMANQGRRVGLVWAGNPRDGLPVGSAVDRRRSLAPERLAPLFEVPGLHLFSLQKDGPAAPPDFPLTDFMTEMTDLADTAALVANLDLVISVDTCVAHLAGAQGKPVWLLDRFDPCWRWLVGRSDSPWYPTLRIYRQPLPGDWDTVLADVARDLREFRAPLTDRHSDASL